MIKKITLVSLCTTITFNAPLYAGSMGDMDFNNWGAVFVSLEGSYTKNAIENFNFNIIGTNNSFFSVKKNQLYGARLAAGAIGKLIDEFGVSAELGWGYYGRTKLDGIGTGIFETNRSTLSETNTLTGFDLLVGASFLQPCYSLFLKAGALAQTNNVNFNSAFFPTAFTSDRFRFKASITSILPEVKLGGSYIFNENWALTLAYMHAFGSASKTTANFDPVTFTSNFDTNLRNPSLHSVMVGVQVSI
ncbi:MAG: hypothetical protein H0U75_01490 [Legionella sp.]|nr:hypothetical protein [Legionella sp.]